MGTSDVRCYIIIYNSVWYDVTAACMTSADGLEIAQKHVKKLTKNYLK